MAPALVIGLGLAVGLEHAFETDHVAAVSTMLSKSRQSKNSVRQFFKSTITKSSLLGAMWGAGHTTTLLIMGFIVYVLAITIQSQVFSGLEFGVGLMLGYLGLSTMLNKKMRFRHKHPHQHKDGTMHFDEHDHKDFEHTHSHKSYIVGLIHGLAGSGSLVVLTAMTLDNVGLVLEFILIFGIGSMIGMVLVSSLLGIPFAFSNRISSIQKIFRYATGIFSLLIGLNIMYQIGIVGNLFGF